MSVVTDVTTKTVLGSPEMQYVHAVPSRKNASTDVLNLSMIVPNDIKGASKHSTRIIYVLYCIYQKGA